MKNKLLLVFATFLASQAQAAVDVSGFTIEGASRPYGLFALVLILVVIAAASMRISR